MGEKGVRNLTLPNYSLHTQDKLCLLGFITWFDFKYRFPKKGHVSLSSTCCPTVTEIILGLPGVAGDSRVAWPEASLVPQLRVGSTLLGENIWLDLGMAIVFYIGITTLTPQSRLKKPECILTFLIKSVEYTRTMYVIRTLTKRCLP